MAQATIKELRREVRGIIDRYPPLKPDQAFLVWFLQAYGGASEDGAKEALPGRAGEKGIDALLIDDNLGIVFLVQAKYRLELMKKSENRNDVFGLVAAGRALAGSNGDFSDFCERIDPAVREKLRVARDRLLRRNYRLQLCFATLGRCSEALETEARRETRKIRLKRSQTATFILYDGNRTILLLREWLDGAAPPVPAVSIRADGGDVIKSRDPLTGIELRVLWAKGSDVADVYRRSGIRIFHRNVRGFLGVADSAINKEMKESIETEPRSFVYLNNGVTIVCDEARLEEDLLALQNPQIINGQQTTRVLDAAGRAASRVAVQIRVIAVPHSLKGKGSDYDELVASIVRATNRQNAIKASDLKANDRVQVILERELQKLNYEYLRKREAKSVARAHAPQHRWVVTKFDLAKAVGATLSEGLPRRIGREKLFETPYYERIFNTIDPRFYLSRYWLMRAVDLAARGSSERKWSKYVVLYFLWQDLGHDIKRRQDFFIRSRENSRVPNEVEVQLMKAIHAAFRAAGRFFKDHRSEGGVRLEISPFYKRKDVFGKFEKFWTSRRNPHRTAFERAGDAFAEALAVGE